MPRRSALLRPHSSVKNASARLRRLLRPSSSRSALAITSGCLLVAWAMGGCSLISDFDQFRGDAGTDGGVQDGGPADAAPPDMGCSSDDSCGGQVCDMTTNTCVECVLATDCTADPNATVCGDDQTCVQCTPSEDDACDAANPYCESTRGRCVECLTGDQCTSPGAARCDSSNACAPCAGDLDCASVAGAVRCADETCVECTVATEGVDCAGATPRCGPDHTCKACVENADCPDDEPVCGADNTCGPCGGAADCSGRPLAGVCDGGACVQCASDSDCGDRGCNLATNVCSSFEADAQGTCEPCESDVDCSGSGFCIAMQHGAPLQTYGSFCLAPSSTGCVAPYSTLLTSRPSVSGAPAQNYCGFPEATVTCDALRMFTVPCSGDDAECGFSGLCRNLDGFGNRCTIRCDSPGTCPSAGPGSTCNNISDPRHCGVPAI